MEALVERVHESCSVSVLDGEDIVYVLRVPTHRIMAASLSIGSRLPLSCTSMGRVLLAGLDGRRVRRLPGARDRCARYTRTTVVQPRKLRQIVHAVSRQGWAYVDQELEEGLRSISVPVRDAQGRIIAAMNVSGQAGRHDEARMVKTFLPALQEAADRASSGRCACVDVDAGLRQHDRRGPPRSIRSSATRLTTARWRGSSRAAPIPDPGVVPRVRRRTLSWGRFREEVDRVAGLLAAYGIGGGDRIGHVRGETGPRSSRYSSPRRSSGA